MSKPVKPDREKLKQVLALLGIDVPEDAELSVKVSPDVEVSEERMAEVMGVAGPNLKALFELGGRMNQIVNFMALDFRRLCTEETAEMREKIAHELLHRSLELIGQRVEEAEAAMPCLRHGDGDEEAEPSLH